MEKMRGFKKFLFGIFAFAFIGITPTFANEGPKPAPTPNSSTEENDLFELIVLSDLLDNRSFDDDLTDLIILDSFSDNWSRNDWADLIYLDAITNNDNDLEDLIVLDRIFNW